jgi:hypothetical protein
MNLRALQINLRASQMNFGASQMNFYALQIHFPVSESRADGQGISESGDKSRLFLAKAHCFSRPAKDAARRPHVWFQVIRIAV